MKISSIKLKEKGLKGCEVSYLKTEMKDGMEYNNEYVAKYKRPVHAVLRAAISELDVFARAIAGVEDSTDIEILGVTAGDDKFLLTVWVDSPVVEKGYVLNTPLIKDADGYSDYNKVQEEIGKVYAEVLKYIEGATADAKQFVLDFNEREGSMSLEEIETMPEADKQEFMRKYLEKKGCVVMTPDIELEEENFEVEEEVKVVDLHEKKEVAPAKKVATR